MALEQQIQTHPKLDSLPTRTKACLILNCTTPRSLRPAQVRHLCAVQALPKAAACAQPHCTVQVFALPVTLIGARTQGIPCMTVMNALACQSAAVLVQGSTAQGSVSSGRHHDAIMLRTKALSILMKASYCHHADAQYPREGMVGGTGTTLTSSGFRGALANICEKHARGVCV
eukprot:1158739-Pelagomonas_calceolata.AAC.6